jgi:hypothetical protein
MRPVVFVLGLVALLVGGVWMLQGAGVLPGSFMTGQRVWLLIGIVMALLGLALVFSGARRPARP